MTPDDLHAALAAALRERDEAIEKLKNAELDLLKATFDGRAKARREGRADALEEGIARLRALKAGMKEFNEGCPVEWDPGELDVVDLCTAALRALKNAPTIEEPKDET